MPVNVDWGHLASESTKHKLGLWSYSKLLTAEGCLRLFQVKYLPATLRAAKVPAFQGATAAVGSFVHEVFAECVNLPDLDALFLPTWKRLLDKHRLVFDEKQQANGLRFSTLNLLNRLRTAQGKWQAQYTPEVKLSFGPWIGFADLHVQFDTATAGVLDYKTHTATANNKEKVLDQLDLYCLLMWLQYPTLQSIKPGAVFIPDEEVWFAPVLTRDAHFTVLAERWANRLGRALVGITSLLESQVPVFPEPKAKVGLCNYCTLPCKRSKVRKNVK